ncbi:Gfo/Idh/MocA family oxidoreductase [Halomontanus rarus]|uniref:Gfo/Idh/MocA family protein n=1 Tax=Halomontanus rarus TaxID=3034020 RepID=UPI00293BA5F4|nr:Gfo/Idh/MocA family oxidoreductase [Halovivax sp. KZCA124]
MTKDRPEQLTVAVIGTGPNSSDTDAPSMAYHHANMYSGLDDCTLIACADLIRENVEAFATNYGIDLDAAYTDHTKLLDEVNPDLVSVCVPPPAHADIVIDCAEHGVGAIHCEKPMALTWGGAKEMANKCWDNNVFLTFNHQRRFGTCWSRANELLQKGKIGQLQRIEMAAPNLFDWGTHAFDLCGKYANEASPEWVLGQIDYQKENIIYGAHQENQAVTTWEYDNGVKGFALTGEASNTSGVYHRLEGTDGEIEIRSNGDPILRYRNRETDDWQQITCERASFTEMVRRSIKDVVRSFIAGERSELCAENALKSTELIFGTWESSRSRSAVELPLEVNDNPLEEMVKNGDLTPQ